MGSVHVVHESRGEALVIALRGSGDASNADTIGLQLSALAAEHPRRVVLDLSGLDYLSSLAVGQIVAFHRSVKLSGGEMIIAGAQPVVREVLVRCRIDALVAIVPRVSDALASKGKA